MVAGGDITGNYLKCGVD